MRVLVIGNGGREHALCWLIRERSPGAELHCAPGSPGTEECAESVALDVADVDGLARFAAEREIGLTVVGPELPLSLGAVDVFRERGLPIFGPTRAAARLESSKIFAKEFMRRHGVPTCDFEVAADREAARRAAERFGLPAVLKADGLAAGKGVLIVSTPADLEAALDEFFVERRFGDAGARVLIEPFVPGEEVSFIGFCDGRRVLPLATSKGLQADRRRRFRAEHGRHGRPQPGRDRLRRRRLPHHERGHGAHGGRHGGGRRAVLGRPLRRPDDEPGRPAGA